jgi:hypothetical protein
MQELIDRLKKEANLTAEQAQRVIETVKDYIKEKYPMLEGAVENVFKEAKASGEDLLDGLKGKVEGFFKQH